MHSIYSFNKALEVKNQYRETVLVLQVCENICTTTTGTYHSTKLFMNGQSLQSYLAAHPTLVSK